MRRDVNDIQIKEPPLQELNKKRSCLKRSCATGCGCIALFLIAVFLFLRFAAAPRPKELATVPGHFPKSITLYDTDAIHRISFISGEQKSRWTEIAGYVPKAILSPLILSLERQSQGSAQTTASAFTWEAFIDLMKKPLTDTRHTLQIEWTDLPAQPKFIENYYKNELKKNNFDILQSTEGDTIRQFLFTNTTTSIDGVLYMSDTPDKDGTDYVSLNVNYPQ
ncbi:MAG TPA: hypothetical protein VEA18_01450 [Candidatus Kapabacteria bacterium]|nr:hypothetical protein [Candidatus Kapabacteria bacterium]